MKARDIAETLAARLPLLVDDFTTNISVLTLTSSGTTVTGTTASAHNIPVGENIGITGATTPIAIDTFARIGTIGTITTSADHDITKSSRVPVDVVVGVEGAIEPEFNGSFTVLAVPNRRTLTVLMDDSGATSATGTLLLIDGAGCFSEYDGVHTITATPTATTFEYEVPRALFSPAGGTIEIRREARITASVTIDRVVDQYTEGVPSSPWIFVVLDDVTASKSRRQESDAVDNNQRQSYYRQQIMQDASIYVIIPTDNDMAASDARDRCEDLLKPICQSILMQRFDTGLTASALNPLNFVSHGFALYNTAYYMHGYSFQQVADMGIGDTVGAECDVAFRNISLTQSPSIGTETIETEINLDDEPLG